jgi:hypothetical protein
MSVYNSICHGNRCIFGFNLTIAWIHPPLSGEVLVAVVALTELHPFLLSTVRDKSVELTEDGAIARTSVFNAGDFHPSVGAAPIPLLI